MRRDDRFTMKNVAVTSGLSIIAVWLGFLVFNLAQKAEVAWAAAQASKAQAIALQQREQELSKNINNLNSPRGQDAAIRTAFGVARPGEQVIVVVPPKPPATTTQASWWDRNFGWLGL